MVHRGTISQVSGNNVYLSIYLSICLSLSFLLFRPYKQYFWSVAAPSTTRRHLESWYMMDFRFMRRVAATFGDERRYGKRRLNKNIPGMKKISFSIIFYCTMRMRSILESIFLSYLSLISINPSTLQTLWFWAQGVPLFVSCIYVITADNDYALRPYAWVTFFFLMSSLLFKQRAERL